jgi:AAA ATPase domain
MPRTGDGGDPYTPDMGVRPPFIAGRDAELDYFRETIEQLTAGGTQKHLILTGLRGVGKTVLLNEFEDTCDRADWHGEVREISDESRIGNVVARSVRRALLRLSAARRAGDAVRRALAALKAFSLTFGDVDLRFDVEVLPGIADSGDLAEDLRDLLVEVGAAARANGVGFALLLDELQNLSRSDLAALIVGLHRAKQKGLPIALVGAGLPMLPALVGEAKSYAERGFEFRGIGALGRVAAEAALSEPARERGVRWQQKALDRIIELAQGYPYFLQEYGRAVWRVGSGSTIRLSEVEAAEEMAVTYLDENFFSQRLGKLPNAERRYMAAIASLGDGPQQTTDVAAVLGKRPQELSVLRDRLVKSSLLFAPGRGTLDFTVPMCADYIRRTMPETRSSEEVLDEMREDRV